MKRNPPLTAVLAILCCACASACTREEPSEPRPVSMPQTAQALPENKAVPPPTPPAPPFDPVEAIKPLAGNLKREFENPRNGVKTTCEVVYDVRKTDSLVTPLVGEIRFKYTEVAASEDKGGPTGIAVDGSYLITLHVENERWTIAKMQRTTRTDLLIKGRASYGKPETETVERGSDDWSKIEGWMQTDGPRP